MGKNHRDTLSSLLCANKGNWMDAPMREQEMARFSFAARITAWCQRRAGAARWGPGHDIHGPA
jgi:hypothetical protein